MTPDPETAGTRPDPDPAATSLWATTFDLALSREMMRTECRRTTMTVAVLVVLLVVVGVLRTVPELTAPEFREQFRRLAVPMLTLLVVYIALESAMRIRLGWVLRAGQVLSRRVRYLQVAMEVSLPTFALLLIAEMLGATQALASSVPFAYFLFIFLTALNLDARLSLFAGILAGLQFAVVSVWLLRASSIEGTEWAAQAPMLFSPHQYVVKAIFMTMTGGIAAFVARSTRRQMEAALRTLEERDRAVSIFGQHVSPQVAEMLLRQSIPAGGEERNVCVMFLDIRDFSRFANGCSPPQLMAYLNQLFGFMIPVVNRHQGIVNKFLGDGFMAVFGAPVEDGEQCRHAADTAFEILAGVDRLVQSGAIPGTRLGIGLHMGQAVTGNVGSLDRKEYTIIGDVVNLASRIEQATKVFSARLVVSAAVWENLAPLGGFQAEDLGPVELKGQAKPVRLYKLA